MSAEGTTQSIAPSSIYTRAQEIEDALDTFLWHSPDHGDVGGDAFIVNDEGPWPELELVLWVIDSQDPDGVRRPLRFGTPISMGDAREQVRDLLREALLHELDEQIDFGGERPFFPHHPNAPETCECPACLERRAS